MQRREFLKNTGLGAVSMLGAAALAGCGGEEKVESTAQGASVAKKESVKIRLAMTWSITMPILSDIVKH